MTEEPRPTVQDALTLAQELLSRRTTSTVIAAHFLDSRGEVQFGEWRSTLDPALLTGAKARTVRDALSGLLARFGGQLLSLQLMSGDEAGTGPS